MNEILIGYTIIFFSFFFLSISLYCLLKSPISAHARKMRNYNKNFRDQYEEKPPEFFNALYFHTYRKYYESDLFLEENPIRLPWWKKVTVEEIEEAFPNEKNCAMKEFFKLYQK